MRILSISKTMSYLAPSLVTTGLFVSSTLAMPLQGTLSTTSKPAKATVLQTKTETSGTTKNAVLVRNTTAKTEPAAKTAPARKSQDKQAVSRCWKRLMNMVREISHARRAKSS